MAYDNLKLTKELYESGCSFTTALEKLDNDDNYTGTTLEDLDAYQRQLYRFNINLQTGVIADFFQTSDSAVLFPEFVRRCVIKGIQSQKIFDNETDILTTTKINSLDYRGMNYTDGKIQINFMITPLRKVSKKTDASYEAIKYQRIDLFRVVLIQIGKSIAKSSYDRFMLARAAYNNYYFEMIVSDIKVDYASLIDRQFENVEIYQLVGFNPIMLKEE